MTKGLMKKISVYEHKTNVSLKKYSTMKVGGNAEIMVFPNNTNELREIVKLAADHNKKIFVLGNGSNLIFADVLFPWIFINTTHLTRMEVKGNTIYSDCGAELSHLSALALKNSLTGLEFASGIPGSVGGALFMNAGAYGGEMKDIVIETEYLDDDYSIKILSKDEHLFAYRDSFFKKNNLIALSTKLTLENGDFEKIKDRMKDLNQRRKEKQPLKFPSAGSIFKRPEGYYSGALIQECNLKGYMIGGAQVSEKHAGFIINSGTATTNDIRKLIEHIQNVVYARYQVHLETEVKIIDLS